MFETSDAFPRFFSQGQANFSNKRVKEGLRMLHNLTLTYRHAILWQQTRTFVNKFQTRVILCFGFTRVPSAK
jgi:hypothetical protein